MSEAQAISLLKRGIANARSGDKALARTLLKQSSELNPDNDAVWLWLAVTATTDEEKIRYLQRALNLNPTNERVRATLNQLQAKAAKRAPKWKCQLCMAPDTRPQHQCKSCKAILSLSELNEILNSDADVGRMQRAIKGYGSVLGQGVDFGAHYNMALAHLNLGEIEPGIKHLRSALEIEPNDNALRGKIDDLVRYFERRQAPSANGASPKPAVKKWVRGTILCVDDSPTIRKLVTMTLKRFDYEIVTAVDGMDALGKLDAVAPDLVLLDISMPRMDGYQVCRIIKNNRETRHIPVIMLSGKDGFFDKVRGRLAGSTMYITKPFDPHVLFQVVEKHALNRAKE